MPTDGDYIAGELGPDGESNIVGKGVQQVSVNLGDRSPAEAAEILRQLNRAVFGDGLGWDGVVQQLRQIRRDVEILARDVATLTTEVATLKQELVNLKQQMSDRTETSRQMQLLLAVVAGGVAILVIIALWPLIFR